MTCFGLTPEQMALVIFGLCLASFVSGVLVGRRSAR